MSMSFHRQLLDLARVLASATDHDQFLARTTEFLALTFRPDRVLWSDIDLARGRVRGTLDPGRTLEQPFADQLLRHAIEHPGISSYLGDPTDLSPRRLSDVVPDRVWSESQVYREVFAAEGGRHQLSLVVELQPTRGTGWTLFREHSDFTDGQVDQARMVLPLLTGFHRMYGRLTPATSLPAMPLAAQLTPREQQVVRLLGEGLTATAMGHRLSIRPATVRKHLEHIYAKFGAHDRVLVVNRARSMGLLSESAPQATTLTNVP